MPQKPLQPNNPEEMNIEEILKFLPHRYPFLLVDRVLKLEKGRSIVALKNVTFNEPFFQGHFPDLKIMPGVLIVESIAQAGGILVYHSIPEPQTKIMFLSKINEAKFKKPVIPGDQMQLEAEIIKLKTNFCFLSGRARINGEIVTEGEMIASLLNIEEWRKGK